MLCCCVAVSTNVSTAVSTAVSTGGAEARLPQVVPGECRQMWGQWQSSRVCALRRTHPPMRALRAVVKPTKALARKQGTYSYCAHSVQVCDSYVRVERARGVGDGSEQGLA